MKSKGYSLIELIVALGLAALFIPAIVFVFSFSLMSARQGESYTIAYSLAQEQMEAIYFLKAHDPNWDWFNYPENNSASDYYQPTRASDGWQLGPKISTPKEENGYVTSVKILPVKRSSGNISDDPLSIDDPTSRKVVVAVSWKENGVPVNIDLVSYVTDY